MLRKVFTFQGGLVWAEGRVDAAWTSDRRAETQRCREHVEESQPRDVVEQMKVLASVHIALFWLDVDFAFFVEDTSTIQHSINQSASEVIPRIPVSFLQ